MDIKLFSQLPEHNEYNNKYGVVPLKGRAPKYHVSPKFKPLLTLIDFIGSAMFFFTKFKPQPKKPRKILVIRLDHLGDIIMTLPTYAALRSFYPDAEIHTLVRGFAQDLFYNNPNVDRVIAFDPPWFSRDKKKSLKETFKFLLNLRREKYDLVIELHADPRNIGSAVIIGGYRVGYGIRGFGFLLNKIVKYPEFNHLVETNVDLVRALGFSGKTPLNALSLHYPKDDEIFAKKLVGGSERFIIINPGTGRINKYWLAERWAKVADALSAEGYNIVLTGSPNDKEECEKVARLARQKLPVLAGRTTIKQLLALIANSSLVLAPDTSLMHFAACLRVPSLTLFGPIPPSICAYESPTNKVMVKNLPCSYCALPVCPRTDNPNECMTSISVDDVLKISREILARPK
jgi:lipopolysaccharide heptosyltransferase II